MMWGYDGWGWLWMASMVILFWGTLVAVAVYGIRALSGSRQTGDGAIETLRRRLAAGEIGPEEFEKTRRILQG